VTVLHHVNGSTRVAVLSAPHISTQETATGGLHLRLQAELGEPVDGFAMFTSAGLVALYGTATEQYGFIEKED